MSTQKTPNYGLIKPGENEFYNISIQNENMDILDTQLKEVFENAGTKIIFKDEIPAEPLPREADRIGGHPASYFATKAEATETRELISTHVCDINNPHDTTASQVGAFGFYGVNTLTNINNFRVLGSILLTTTVTNSPPNSSPYATVYNLAGSVSDGTYLTQYWFDASNKRTYIRHYVDAVWYAWKINYDTGTITISNSAPAGFLGEDYQHQVY